MRIPMGALVLLAMIACTSVIADGAFGQSIVAADGVVRGTIVIKTAQRRLYLGIGGGKAIQYSVGVGRAGRQWTGRRWISAKTLQPAWRPTEDILRDKPGMSTIPGGSPRNPMGAAALLISGRGQYAIHGTNNPSSIGGFVSYGCIRMRNSDILDLFSRVRIGTPVLVVH